MIHLASMYLVFGIHYRFSPFAALGTPPRWFGKRGEHQMKKGLLAGTAYTAICLALTQQPMRAATLDDVMARLDALERNNAKLAKENAQLRDRVNHITSRPAPATATASAPKGNPVQHAAVAPSPAPAPEHAIVSIGGAPIYSKAPGSNPFIDNTTVTLYGHVDLSGDVFNAGVFDQGTKFGVASNLSYFGVRARHNLAPYGFPGWAAIAQFESLVEVAAVPTERAAFGTRDSFIGMETPWGHNQGRQGRYALQEIDFKVRSILGNTGRL
ncbi:hypothetical protein MTX20_27890 [Bradyrhizobium sp. ISRA435]|nr:hypothetical protein MTX20_27890 [Bradyrhizobium sp. ISRA435]